MGSRGIGTSARCPQLHMCGRLLKLNKVVTLKTLIVSLDDLQRTDCADSLVSLPDTEAWSA